MSFSMTVCLRLRIFSFSKSFDFDFSVSKAFLRECENVYLAVKCLVVLMNREYYSYKKKQNFYIYNNSFTPGDEFGLIDLSEIPLHTDLQPKWNAFFTPRPVFALVSR